MSRIMVKGIHLFTSLLTGASNLAIGSIAIQWEEIAPLPVEEGFAGGFSGVTGEVLVFAGGTNFAGTPPWKGGTKVWYSDVFVLESPMGSWIPASNLPRPLGYGASVSTTEGMILIGGCDENRHYADVLLLRWDGSRLRTERLPNLPVPTAYCAAWIHDRVIYCAAGTPDLSNKSTEKPFWYLNLDDLKSGWQLLPPWPGPARMMPVMAGYRDEVFLFSGKAVDPDVPAESAYLMDAYAFNIYTKTWRKLASMPFPASGAPSPAPVTEEGKVIVLGGNDGSLGKIPPYNPPYKKRADFPREPFIYDVKQDFWTHGPELPFAQKVTSVANWHGQWIVTSGEIQPGIRTPTTWSGIPVTDKSTD